ncbi:MAG: FecR family protein [Pseudomonadota bacterium]
MSKVLKFPESEKIEEIACAWVARLDAGNLSEAETRSLEGWIAADPRHEDALLAAATLFDQMTVVSSLNKILPLDEVAMADRVPANRWQGSTLTKVGIAAALMLVALLFTLNRGENPVPELTDVFRTEVGELRKVALVDSTQVTMNSASVMLVHFSDRQRRVTLQEGEALFEVAHDATRRFVVEANGNEIHAIGTAFNVSLAGTGTEITVTEGVVEIISISDLTPSQLRNGASPAGSLVSDKGRKQNFLVAGEAMTINDAAIDTRTVDEATIDAKLSWQRGQLVFRGESLEYVVAQVSRYSTRSLIITDDDIRAIPIGGVFETGDIDNLVDVLEKSLDIDVQRRADGNFYLSRKTAVDE